MNGEGGQRASALRERFQALIQEHHKMLEEDREVGTLSTGLGVQYLRAALNETIRTIRTTEGYPLHAEPVEFVWQRSEAGRAPAGTGRRS